jgi:ribosomal protein S18 acetylase RimI-like enzyme
MQQIEPHLVARLQDDSQITSFDCGDKDLNDFLAHEALLYAKERLAITHVVLQDQALLGYFSLLSDKLAFDPSNPAQKKSLNRFNRSIPNEKRRKSYPAIKIGRLAVASHLSGQGIGTLMINKALDAAIGIQDIAVRFVTVDAYQTAFSFYKKNGFEFMSEHDADEHTRQMYFDLKRIAEVLG